MNQTLNVFDLGHWIFEIGYCLLFVDWSLEFSQLFKDSRILRQPIWLNLQLKSLDPVD